MENEDSSQPRKRKQTEDLYCWFSLLVSYFKQFVLGCATSEGVHASQFQIAGTHFSIQSFRTFNVDFIFFNLTVSFSHRTSIFQGEELCFHSHLEFKSYCHRMMHWPTAVFTVGLLPSCIKMKIAVDQCRWRYHPIPLYQSEKNKIYIFRSRWRRNTFLNAFCLKT